jgi:two-component system response regulator HydG
MIMAKTKSGKKSRILIIEDDGAQADAMAETLRRVGHDCVIVTAPRRALDIIKRGGFDLVLTDLKMGEIDGMEILRASKREMPDVDVIMVTGYGTIHSAVEAMKHGASDYITKPLNVDELRECVARGIERRRAVVQEEEQTGGGIERFGFVGIIGNDPGLLHVISTARQIARTSATILIQGESGTGKELLARAIHNNSPGKRAVRPREGRLHRRACEQAGAVRVCRRRDTLSRRGRRHARADANQTPSRT